ncbi:hypothetical protein Tco_0504027, partial [Tanacetum coccineum]
MKCSNNDESSSRVFSNPNPPDFVVDPADFLAIGTATNSRTGLSPNLVMAEQAVCDTDISKDGMNSDMVNPTISSISGNA